MIVTIPVSKEHQGLNLYTVEISEFCPVCGGPRGKVFGSHAYDGSRRLNVDSWNNHCGHIDAYADVRFEGKQVAYKEPTPFRHEAVQSIPF